jgi:PASTA domain
MMVLTDNFSTNTGQLTAVGYSGSPGGTLAITGNEAVLTLPSGSLTAYGAYENGWALPNTSPSLLVSVNIGSLPWAFPFVGSFQNYGPGIAKDVNNQIWVEVSAINSTTQINMDLLFLSGGTQHNISGTSISTTSLPDKVAMGIVGNSVTAWLSFAGVWQAVAAITANVGAIYDFTAANATVGWFPGVHYDMQGSSISRSISASLLRFSQPFTNPTTNVTVPSTAGSTLATAEAAIIAANLTVCGVTTSYSSTVAAGNVISTSPASGVSAPFGSCVTIVESLGIDPNIRNLQPKFVPAACFLSLMVANPGSINPRVYPPKEDTTIRVVPRVIV